MKNKKAPKKITTPVLLGESQKNPQGFPSKDASRGFFYARRHLARFNVSSFSPTFNFFKKTKFEFISDLVFYSVLLFIALSTVRGCEDSTDRDYIPMLVTKTYHHAIKNNLNPEIEIKRALGVL
jgi:hypothetical protein